MEKYSASETRYSNGENLYRRCGDSGILLPKVSLGFWQNFGAEASYDNCRSIARMAFDNGITHFDLANNYGPPPGFAEEMVGRMLKEDFASHRDELLIATKAGYDIALTKAVSESVDIPVIASGGAGKLEHFYDAFNDAKADAVLAASLFNFNEILQIDYF